MNKALKFDLFGKYAFIKNPESNTGTEFSFEHLHKPIVLGILGAVLGYKGKESITKQNPYPEYYQKLKDIKISIIPKSPIFNSFQETKTNTTGFANKNGTQVFTKDILEDVRWTIYILKDSVDEDIWEQLVKLLSKHESKYPLYLGNNSFQAKIDNFEEISVDKIEDEEEIVIDSIFNRNIIEEKYEFTETDKIIPFDLTVYFPVDINELCLYEYDWLEHTNLLIDVKSDVNLYEDNDKTFYFM